VSVDGWRPLLRHRLVAVGCGEDPRGGAELGGAEALDVARAVGLLVVAGRQRVQLGQGAGPAQHLLRQQRMELNPV